MTDFYITYSGREIHPDNITSEDISLIDIAHHLTYINRYGGALEFNKYYSVAEHSLHMAKYAKKYLNTMATDYTVNTVKMALLHDASEAYLGDIVSALKKQLLDYQKLEEHVQHLIYEKYDVQLIKQDIELVSTLDKRILLDEAVNLLPYRYSIFKTKYAELTPLGVSITGQNDLQTTYDQYLQLCADLEIYDD